MEFSEGECPGVWGIFRVQQFFTGNVRMNVPGSGNLRDVCTDAHAGSQVSTCSSFDLGHTG